MKRIDLRRVLLVPAVASIIVTTAIGAAGAAGVRSAGPKPGAFGGTVNIGGYNVSVVDPAQSGYTGGGGNTTWAILGNLLDNPTRVGAPFVPDIALSGTFNKGDTEYTLHLRPGEKFSDGSPVNAQAVLWTWNRYTPSVANPSQYFKLVSSMTAKGKYTIVVKFNGPDSAFGLDLASTPAGSIESPTAFNAEGATTFAYEPVGAGPFKVQSSIPAQSITLVKNPNYWDAKHVYLSEISFTNTGTDPTANYDDLTSDAIDVLAETGTSSPPVIQEALANKNFNQSVTPDYSVTIGAINTFAAPFNNQLAREAVNYCMDRTSLANNTQAGYATPAWVLAGPASLYYPQVNGKNSVQAAQKLQPYQYNPAMGTQLVNQLGGLSFTVLDFSTQNTVIATAMQASWAQCGIKANVQLVAASVINPDLINGTYQMILTGTGGNYDPRLATTFLLPTQSLDTYGFNDPKVTAWVEESYATTSVPKLDKLWTEIWSQMNQDGVALPILTSGGWYLSSKCIKDIEFHQGVSFTTAIFTHSYLVCKP